MVSAMDLQLRLLTCTESSYSPISSTLLSARRLLLLRHGHSSRNQEKRRLPATISCSSELQTSSPLPLATGMTAPSSSIAPNHRVTVHDRQRGVIHEFIVPEDQYILHTAEAQNISLPFACRHGCCTSCAVRVKSGQIRQPEALGISAELKSKGYALLCVGFPSSDLEVETQDEDEVYWLQFGRYFARGPIVQATWKKNHWEFAIYSTVSSEAKMNDSSLGECREISP